MTLWLRCYVLPDMAFENIAVVDDGVAKLHLGAMLTFWCSVPDLLQADPEPGLRYLSKGQGETGQAAGFHCHCYTQGLSRIISFRVLLATRETECCACVDAMLIAPTVSGKPASTIPFTRCTPIKPDIIMNFHVLMLLQLRPGSGSVQPRAHCDLKFCASTAPAIQ